MKIENITEKELNNYLKSIGGLESGYGNKYWGNSKIRKFFYKITNWILWRLPYYHKTKTFSYESSFSIFIYNIFYWMFKWLLKDKKPKNPFRSMIYNADSFSISQGWNGLMKKLIEEAITAGWNKEICQVKEKFGGLRFYINSASKEVHDIISHYEEISYTTCEDCGEPGETRAGGWIRTLCKRCYNIK